MSREAVIRVATDVGGTFTDLVYLQTNADGTQITGTAKAGTTPPDFEQGIMNTLSQSSVDIGAIHFFVHGTTVIINAITERKGGKTGLITTRGFRDVLEIARGNRPDFFNLNYRKPAAFVPRYLRREVTERVSFKGEVLTPLDLTELSGILEDFRKEEVEAIAICLLNAYADPLHEEMLLQKIAEVWPEVEVIASHQITREWREYERSNTTVLSAYVKPVARHYLEQLAAVLQKNGMAGMPYIMQSNCGVDTLQQVCKIPIRMLESGPASGVWGAASLGKMIGEQDLITLDIGGTTAKCSLIQDGQVRINTQYILERNKSTAGYPVMIPVVDLVEIGNGGGSIAWVDSFEKLHVGPQSAGAVPGPVAYGKGGQEITTTDANLFLGRINPAYFCGGTIPADMDTVDTVLGKLGNELEMEKEALARGVIRLANHNMINAIKLVSVNRGHNPAEFTMMAFGGGGGMHACALAAELGITKVIVPCQAEVFSAWGMLTGDLRRDFIQTYLIELDDSSAVGKINCEYKQLETKALTQIQDEGYDISTVQLKRYGWFRYQNQAHTIETGLPSAVLTEEILGGIRENFHRQYEHEYTYQLDAPVELVSLHLIASISVGKIQPEKIAASGRSVQDAIKQRRLVDYDDLGIHRADIYDANLLEPGMRFLGPAIIESAGATTVVPPGYPVHIDSYGNTHIEIQAHGRSIYHEKKY